MEAALPPDPAWTRLLDVLAPHRDTGLVVAFSGGLDSAILLDAALEALGRERVTAFTAVSPSLSPRRSMSLCISTSASSCPASPRCGERG